MEFTLQREINHLNWGKIEERPTDQSDHANVKAANSICTLYNHVEIRAVGNKKGPVIHVLADGRNHTSQAMGGILLIFPYRLNYGHKVAFRQVIVT